MNILLRHLSKFTFSVIAFFALVIFLSSPAYAAVQFDIDHESGDLSEYDTTQDGADLSVTSGAALAGTSYGMAVLTDDGTASYAYKSLGSGSTTGVARARFYIDPNSVTIPDGNQTSVLWLVNTPAVTDFALVKLMNIGGQYALRGVIIDDNNVHQETVPFYITDAPHYIEIRVTKSTTVSSNDATYETWLDGVAQTTMTGKDLYNNFSDLRHAIFGQLSATTGVSGTYYLDELVVNDDGGLIGPVGGSSNTLTGGSVTLSDPRPSLTSTYTMQFDNVALSAIKCIKVTLSDAEVGGSPPTGIDTSGVTYSAAASNYIPDAQTWTAAQVSTGIFKITNSTGETPASATDRIVAVTGITNGSITEVGYFAQFSTYNNIDCSSSPVDTGLASFIYTGGQLVTITVDPTISFDITSVAGSQSVNGATTTVSTTDGTIPFGNVTTGALSIAAHDLTVTTNAGSGYTVYIRYTAKPTSGSNDIDDHSGSNASPTSLSAGTEAFAYTTDDSSLGTGTAARFTTSPPKWAAFTTSNTEIAYSNVAVNSQTTRIGYALGISASSAAGTYGNSTVILTAMPTY